MARSVALAELPHELAHAISASHRLNPRLNAFTSLLSASDALQELQTLDRSLPWRGIPIAVKDNFCTQHLRTTASSKMLREYSSPFEATVVSRLRRAGAVVTGKTNMDEFGMGSGNKHSAFGPAFHRVHAGAPPRSAGGSSGGSALAVALGLCRVALASDTGGSTRLPAAYCGVVGFKPSYGLLSRWGLLAYASSLDCVGIMARDVVDVATAFDILDAHDEEDPTSVSESTRERARRESSEGWPGHESPTNLAGMRIGIPSVQSSAELFLAEVSPDVLPPLRRALDLLKSLGATLHPVSLPTTPKTLSAYYVIASAEANSNLAKYDGVRYGFRSAGDLPQKNEVQELRPLYAETRSQGFGKEVQKRLLLGAFALSADAFNNYYLNAQRVRAAVRADFGAVFRSPSVLGQTSKTNNEGVDILLQPSAISTAPLLSGSSTQSSDVEGYTQDILNVPASLAGLPALSLPVGLAKDGLPVGAQIVGQWGHDRTVLAVARALQVAGKNVFEVIDSEARLRANE